MSEDTDSDLDPGPGTERDRGRDRDEPPLEAGPTDSIDLAHAERVHIGVTRGERDLELGPPRDFPDRADVSVRPERADDRDEGDAESGDRRIVVSVDAMAGDHGTGHADAVLTPAEARAVRDALDETVRWMDAAESDAGGTESRSGAENGDG